MEITFAQMLEIEARKEQRFQNLRQAVHDRDYPALYAALNEEKKPLLHDKAHQLCKDAIHSGCTVKAFQTILEHSAPTLEELVDYGAAYNYLLHTGRGGTGGLVQEAAAYDRSDILQYLLEQGCSPNKRGKSDCSALEAALWRGAVSCVSLLEQRDDVDFTVTETILKIWGNMGMEPEQDDCFRIAAGRLLGEGKGAVYAEVPLLPGLTVCHAAEHYNWPLVHRLCQEGPVTEQQGKRVLDLYMGTIPSLDVWDCARLLDSLFTACPGLLSCEYPRYILTLCMLCGEEDAVDLLRRWMEQMPGRKVVLCGRRLVEPEYDITHCLQVWDERMERFLPVLRRDRLLPVRDASMGDDDCIRTLLKRCEVRGKALAGEVSRLATDVLQMASPELLAELMEERKLFSEEDWEALLQYCERAVGQQRREKRAVLLAYHEKEVDYEL